MGHLATFQFLAGSFGHAIAAAKTKTLTQKIPKSCFLKPKRGKT
jgi:hypothetical protein